jgi:hypothetical protein
MSLLENIKERLYDTKEALRDMAKKASEELEHTGENIQEKLTEWKRQTRDIAVMGGAKAYLGAVKTKEAFEDLGHKVTEKVEDVGEDAKEKVKDISHSVGEKIEKAGQIIKS